MSPPRFPGESCAPALRPPAAFLPPGRSRRAGVSLSQLGGGSITLTNTGSTYGGTTTIDNGTVVVSANVLPNQTGPLGLASSAILVGNTSGSGNATLLIDTAGVQFGRDVQLQSGNAGIATVGATNTSGTVTYSGNIILGSASAAAMPLTITAAPGGTVVFSGPLSRASGAAGSNDSVTMVGGGTASSPARKQLPGRHLSQIWHARGGRGQQQPSRYDIRGYVGRRQQ